MNTTIVDVAGRGTSSRRRPEGFAARGRSAETFCGDRGLKERVNAGNNVLGGERDVAKAEGLFERALAVAREQEAKSWELRAAMSMARL
jgi:hypothetical protein